MNVVIIKGEKKLKPSVMFPDQAYLTFLHKTRLCMCSHYCCHCTELQIDGPQLRVVQLTIILLYDGVKGICTWEKLYSGF